MKDAHQGAAALWSFFLSSRFASGWEGGIGGEIKKRLQRDVT
jgi:hypothetical protein